ncbi:PGN_0703 family putative restriction endonuclease [Novosphingobium kaempferiae]|uniref:PGN_0703 family putative restriction endonuclease n=1 Tax=Novosphingobium kaempferiae TaxID=2896849 RepID=UPI001E3B75C1|nr:hypothetical protein [Novosphingobium kaempferiae]
MNRTHLPLVPEPILRRFRVNEPNDTRFRSCARLLQSLWRSGRELRPGRHVSPNGDKRWLGSRINDYAARRGGNFMTPEISKLAYLEHAYREPWATSDEQRLWTNLLSSHPLVFNALGPLRLDPELATAMLRAMFPDLADATADTVLFEHSPGRGAADLTEDHTAWDAAITYARADGTKGVIAIEMKYSESGWEPIKELRKRYADLMPAAGLFIDPMAPELRKRPIQQLMREHVLLQSAIMRGDYAEGRFVVILPELNTPMQRACQRYAGQLADPTEGKASFSTLNLEAFIGLMRSNGDEDYADDLRHRYCAWEYIDEVIAEGIPAELEG